MKKKFVFNNDKNIVKQVVSGIKECGGYCPCIPRYLHTEYWKCPCKKFIETKDCHCGLYETWMEVSEDFTTTLEETIQKYNNTIEGLGDD